MKRVVPGRPVEGIIGLVEASLRLERQAEMVVGLGIARARVLGCEAPGRSSQVFLSECVTCLLVIVDADEGVGSGVVGISTQGFLVIVKGINTRVVNLLDAQPA